MEDKELKINPKKLILQLDFCTDENIKKETKNYKIRKQSFEIIYSYKEGIIEIYRIGDSDNKTQEKILIRTCQDRRNREITEIEMLENIEEITRMNFEEFKSKILTPNREQNKKENKKNKIGE